MNESVRSRFHKIVAGELPQDRLLCLEWAWWWDKTIDRWVSEGMPAGMDEAQTKAYFGLDVDYHLWFPRFGPAAPPWPAHGKPFVRNMDEYLALLPALYPDPIPFDRDQWRAYAQQHSRGEVLMWFNMDGFFWWPRLLLGIEEHLYAFYDQPELIHRINEDQLAYMKRCVDEMCRITAPDMMTFPEDMSYNHGPMISRGQFDDFMAPYYRRIIPYMKERGIVVLIDSDGQIEPLIPWFQSVGIEGIGPLERMAGVDINRIRRDHPKFIMIGGFDKMTMPLGEQAMRDEFERILPVMRSGRYFQTVDHQTPPGVSLEQYRTYRRLQDEYARTAVSGK